MTVMEQIAIVVGGLVGYWVIAAVLGKARDQHKENIPATKKPAAAVWQSNPASGGPAFGQDEDGEIARSWAQILGVPESASKTVIIAAYRSKMRQYDRQSLAQMGPELREAAKQKSARIQKAYDYAMR